MIGSEDTWFKTVVYKEYQEVNWGGKTWVSMFSGNLGNTPGISGAWEEKGSFEAENPEYGELDVVISTNYIKTKHPKFDALRDFPMKPMGRIIYKAGVPIPIETPKDSEFMIGNIYAPATSTLPSVMTPSYPESITLSDPHYTKLTVYIKEAMSNIKISFRNPDGTNSDWSKVSSRLDLPKCSYTYTTLSDEADPDSEEIDKTVPLTTGYLKDVPNGKNVTVHLLYNATTLQFVGGQETMVLKPKPDDSELSDSEWAENVDNYIHYSEYTNTFTVNVKEDNKKGLLIPFEYVQKPVQVETSDPEALQISTSGDNVSYNSGFTFQIFSLVSPTVTIYSYDGTTVLTPGSTTYTGLQGPSHLPEDGPDIYTVTIGKVYTALKIKVS